MNTTELIWTALPAGRTADTVRLSVHVQPRLSTTDATATLADFPALVSWPPEDLALRVELDGNVLNATVVGPPADPEVWSAVFPPTAPVEAHEVPNLTNRVIHTYPMGKLAQFLRQQYGQTAALDPEEYPLIADMRERGFGEIDFAERGGRLRYDEARAALTEQLTKKGVVDTRDGSGVGFDFVQHRDFHEPEDIADPAVLAELERGVDEPTLHVHKVLSFVGQHPRLLRLLGLVFDVEVNLRGAAPSSTPTVRIAPSAPVLAGVTNIRPWTHAILKAEEFRAQTSPGTFDMADGYLTLEQADFYDTTTVDVDGGAMKAVAYAGTTRRMTSNRTSDTPDRRALPSLRTGGISVFKRGRAQEQKTRFGRMAAMQSDAGQGQLHLWAEDLVRGYRVDVFDTGGKRWHSLVARTGTIEFPTINRVEQIDDEGFVSSPVMRKPLRDDFFVGESLFTFDGWSLVAARPGMILNKDPDPDNPAVQPPAPSAHPDFPAVIQMQAAPGSLPRLRFGQSYRLRARTVDLAGNSEPFGDPDKADFSHATAEVRYGRFEPAQTPPVALREPVGPGESLETVVLRSNYDTPPSPATAERHVVPAKVAQLMLEEHGQVDVEDPQQPGTTVVDPAAYMALAQMDDANLSNHPDMQVADPDDPDRTRHYPTDDLTLHHAPDPIARGAALKLLDGPFADSVVRMPFEDGVQATWPHLEPFRLVLSETAVAMMPGAGAPGTTLEVPLEKGDVIRARLSAFLDGADLDTLGIWEWMLEQGLSPVQVEQMRKRAQTGQHWMLTPYRDILLVHAVRQPLLTPEFPGGLGALRQLGQTYATITGKLRFSRRSTSRTDVIAQWQEPVDAGPDGAPPDETMPFSRQPGGTAFILETDHDAFDPVNQPIRSVHEFGDTKRRKVTYEAIATSRFTEYFTETDQFTLTQSEETIILATDGKGVVPGSVKCHVVGAEGALTPLRPDVHFSVDVAAGMVMFSADDLVATPPVDAPGAGDVVRIRYLVPPVTRRTAPAPDGFGPAVVDVPSSARPAAPNVAYVLPTFRWEHADTEDDATVRTIESRRHGGGLRVYLERPWWSSGEGELLGVVTWPGAELTAQPDLAFDHPLTPLVTHWGQDPLFAGARTPTLYPRLSAFTRAVESGSGLTLHEVQSSPAHTVGVAGHEVAYDPDRELWYCDIAVDIDTSYTPFIRLALARYQPNSVADAHLSRVVLADFMQLTPDRFVSIVFDDAEPTHLGVSLTGPSYTASTQDSGPGDAFVTVEERIDVGDDDLGWEPVDDPISMAATLNGTAGEWFASVHLPDPEIRGRFRLVIEQYEALPEERTEPSQQANPFIPLDARRIVHTDIIRL